MLYRLGGPGVIRSEQGMNVYVLSSTITGTQGRAF